MEDIAPKLLEKIKQSFEQNYLKSEKILDLKNKLVKGKASYKDAHAFAIEVGNLLADAFGKNLSSDVLPDGRLYYNIADRIIRPMLKEDFELVAEHTVEIQTILNRKSGVGLNAVPPKLNEDKVKGIIDITSGKESFDEIAYMLGEPIVNFSQAIVDDTVRANADFQDKAGLSPKIIRTSSGKCCAWCDKIAGVYDYSKIKSSDTDVFKRHRSCICLVEFETSKNGKIQNVHSKKMAHREEVKKRIQNSYTKNKEKNKWTRVQGIALQKKLLAEMEK